MKSVLLSGPLLTHSGYGFHIRQVAKWLFRVATETHQLDITTEPTPWGKCHLIVDPEAEDGLIGQILQASNNKKNFYDVTLQLKLPNEWNPFIGNFNIGITAGVETDKCNPTWIDCINRMDMVIVPSEFTKQTFLNTGDIKVPLVVIPEAFPESFKGDSAALDLGLKTKFNFLIVGQLTGNNTENDRKNLPYTIKWLAETFAGYPDVGIVLKTNSGALTQLDKRNVTKIFSKLVGEVSKPNGPTFYLLHGHMSDEEMHGLYKHPDIKALVTFTHGEGYCCLSDTPIITYSGLKEIKDVVVGEKVLTHTGQWKPVTKLLRREYDGEMIVITPYNAVHKKITLTPNHRVYTYNPTSKEYSWKPAGELLMTDCLIMPKAMEKITAEHAIDLANYVKFENLLIETTHLSYIHSNNLHQMIKRSIKADASFGKLLGYYFAEGNSTESGDVVFSLHSKEKDTLGNDIVRLMSQVFGVENHRFNINENKLTVHFHSRIVANAFSTFCGKGARNKVLNSDLVQVMSSDSIDGFITGTMLGDGYIKPNSEFSLELGSKSAIRQIRLLLLERGIISSFSKQHRIGEVCGTHYDNWYYRIRVSHHSSKQKLAKLLNNHCSWLEFQVEASKHISKGRPKSNFDDATGNLHLEIKTITKTSFNGTVFNLSVQDDESYCTEDFAVHNCLPVLEAAACGLPVIATNWSGHLEFLKHGKFIAVDYKLATIPDSRVDNQIFMKDVKWANPIELDAKRRLKKFYEAPQMPKQWATELATKIQEQYSFEAIASIYSNLLDEHLKADQ